MSMYLLSSGTPNAATFAKLSEPVCNDDFTPSVRYSSLTVQVSAGEWYYVRVTPYKTLAVPAGSSYVLNVRVNNLVESGEFPVGSIGRDWTLSGKGISDDSHDCTDPQNCMMRINHSALGPTKLMQVIDSLKGVAAPVGSTVYATADINSSGSNIKLKMILQVTYTDGTSEKVVDSYTPIQARDSRFDGLDAWLTTDKPVAKILVRFIDKTKNTGWVTIEDVRVITEKSNSPTRLALPLPAGPK
jgi:hypothetical protein